MKKAGALLLLGGLVATLSGCDPQVEYQQVVQNDTDYAIWLVMHDSYPHDEVYTNNYEQDSFLIGAHSEVVLYETSHIGKTTEYGECLLYVDSITTRIDAIDSLKLGVNLTDTYAWQFKEFDKNNTGRCECRFTILSEHIEVKHTAQP